MYISDAEISVDEVLEVLSHSQRRKLLNSLITDSPPDDATYTYVEVDADPELYHLHLPKLADYGLIVWDQDSEIITKGPNFEGAKELLDSLAEHEDLPVDEIAL